MMMTRMTTKTRRTRTRRVGAGIWTELRAHYVSATVSSNATATVLVLASVSALLLFSLTEASLISLPIRPSWMPQWAAFLLVFHHAEIEIEFETEIETVLEWPAMTWSMTKAFWRWLQEMTMMVLLLVVGLQVLLLK